jgi:AcrR family transcriptional regulator
MPSGDERQRNPRGQGTRLREEITDAAARLLERTGRDSSITLRAVAREAGVAPPSIYPHFASPAEILGAVLSRALIAFATMLRTAAEDVEPAREKLIERSLAYIRFAREQPRRYRLLFERTALDSVDEVFQPGSDVIAQCEAAFGAFIGVVAQAQAEAGLHDAEPAADATLLWAALHGYIVLRASNPDVPWPDSDSTAVERLVNRLCGV